MAPPGALERLLDPTCRGLQRALRDQVATVSVREIGRVDFVGAGIARLRGLPGVRSQELVRLHDDVLAMALDLEARDVGVVLLDPGESLTAGSEARRTGRVLDVPVGESLLGRIVTPLGSPLDGGSPIRGIERRPAEREAPAIIQRAPVSVPLQTGLKAVDALVPIGRGQRELILGDRQTGKTAIAADAIINQRSTGVICVYCAIGQRRSAIAKLIEQLRARGAWQHTIVVAAEGGTPPGLQFVAPYAATTMAEYFVERGHDVLIVYDDLTRHAVAYRELSLLLRRPPGREAFPGDIFYVHSRLLERSTRYRDADGGGSLTALPIAETEAQNIAGYIPTNLISITDGQIYLSPELFRKGVLPAVDIGRSVSRVGGKAQLAAFRTVAAQLRLAYAQFEELESFARFGTRLDDAARQAIARGQRVREVLKQPQLEPLSAATQIAVLLAVGEGLLDASLLTDIAAIEGRIHAAVAEDEGGHFGRLQAGGDLTAETRRRVNTVLRHAIEGPRDDGQPR